MERRAANKRHNLEIDSQERRNMQSIALSVALEKWKVDFADAVKTRDALVADDLKKGVSGRSRCVEDAQGYESIEVAVERIIELINRVAPKAGIQADKNSPVLKK
jgi:hypothetical protein